MYIQRNIKLSYSGKLLVIDKNITGVVTPTKTTAINTSVKKGYYLVIDSFSDSKTKNVFFEILDGHRIILVRIKDFKVIDF